MASTSDMYIILHDPTRAAGDRDVRLLVTGLGISGGSIAIKTINPAAGVAMDFDGGQECIFKLSANIGGAKAWSFANAASAKRFDLIFTVTGSFPQTFPASVKMNSAPYLWNTATKEWTPLDAGTYHMSGFNDGATWWITIDEKVFT